MPKISVIIPCYNSAAFLGYALESVLRQSYTDYEILIVNDGSTDSTEALARAYQLRHPHKIIYIYHPNMGPAATRNIAIEHAKGEYLALLDADDRWLPQRLMETVRELDSNKQVGIVHANITRISIDSQMIDTPSRDIRYLNGMIFEHLFLRREHIACPTVLFPRRIAEEVGLFDENLSRLGCEDRDLWLRIAQRYPVRYVDKVLAYYRITPNSMSSNLENILRARLYVVNKFCPPDRSLATPSQTILRRQALGQIYREHGDTFLERGYCSQARNAYREAIQNWPFAKWPWINYLKTFQPFKCRL